MNDDRHQFSDSGEHVPILCDACNREGLNEAPADEIRAILFAGLDKVGAP